MAVITYTDINGCTSTRTITVSAITTSLPPNGTANVACPALAIAPTPPINITPINQTCPLVQPVGPTITNNPNPISCEGTREYAYTYTDCANNFIGTWTFTYTIERQPFTLPANGAATVACPALAVAPTLPTVTSNCGEVLTPAAPVVTNVPNPLTCEGTRTYAYTYTDCCLLYTSSTRASFLILITKYKLWTPHITTSK